MAQFERQRSRRHVRSTLCAPHRWRGNARLRCLSSDDFAAHPPAPP